MRRLFVFAVLATALGHVSAYAQPILVFDNHTGASNFSTSSTPNTFMGDGYNLLSGTTDITGFDLYPVNTSGTNFNAIRLNVFVWGGVNTTGTVNAATPAFSNLLSQYQFVATGTFTSGFFFPFESANPGVTPGIVLPAPLTIPGTQIGLSFSYEGSTDGGTTYATANNLTSIISGNGTTTVGSDVFNGYYRNAGTPTETDGNFTSGLRALGGVTNQSLGVRVYGDVTAVPEPTSMALMGGMLGIAAVLRRRTLAVAAT